MNTQNELENQVLQVPIEDIIPNRFQPRLSFDDESLQDLADSIKQHGIIQPLVLRRKNDKYEIIAGERRYKAAKMAGLVSVPAVISNLSDNESAEVAIVENVQRKDLTAIEEAKSYQALLDKGYMTQEELARKMGLSQSAISNKLRLLTLDESVQDAILNEKISERHARTLLKVPSHEMQRELLDRVINERLTVKQLEEEIKKILDGSESSEAKEKPNDVVVPEIPSVPEIPEVPEVPEIPEVSENEQNEDDVEEIIDLLENDTLEDVPLVDNNLDIDRVINNAVDIQVQPKEEMLDFIEPMSNQELESAQELPNKFFNSLEDSVVNMNFEEPVNQISVKEDDNIEMLDDFIIPKDSNEKVMNNDYLDGVIKTIRNLNLDSDKVVVEEINLPTEYHINIKIKKDKL